MPSHRDQDPSGTTSRPHHTIRYTYGRNSPRRPGSPRPTRITSSSSSLSPSLPATSSSSLPSLNLRGLPSVSSIASSIESEVLPSPSSLRFALLQKPYDNETVQTHEEQVQKLQDDMKQLQNNIRRDGQCSICMELMQNPYALTKCGHTFCATCLDAAFREHLTTNLNNLCQQLAIYPTLKSPKYWEDFRKLVTKIKRLRKKPLDVFRYPCPLCRTLATESPVASHQLGALLTSFQVVTGENITSSHRSGGPTLFSNLFIQELSITR